MFVVEPNETNSLALPDLLFGLFVAAAAVWSCGKSWVDLKSVKLLPLHKSPNLIRNAMTQKSATEPFLRFHGSSISLLFFLIHSFLEVKKHPQMNKLSSQTAAHWGTEFPAACQCKYSLVKAKVYHFSGCSCGSSTAKYSGICLCERLVGSGLQRGRLKLSWGISHGFQLISSKIALNWTDESYKNGLYGQCNNILISMQLIWALFLLYLQSWKCNHSGSPNL